jgi:hypothetical protein
LATRAPWRTHLLPLLLGGILGLLGVRRDIVLDLLGLLLQIRRTALLEAGDV